MCDDFLICPITQGRLVDPVVDPEGNTYERSAILNWLSREHTSPLTRNRLTPEMLVPNRMIASILASTETDDNGTRRHRQPAAGDVTKRQQDSDDQVQWHQNAQQQAQQQSMAERERLSPSSHPLSEQHQRYEQQRRYEYRNQEPIHGVYSYSSSPIGQLSSSTVTINGVQVGSGTSTYPGGYVVSINGNNVSVGGVISTGGLFGVTSTPYSNSGAPPARGSNTNCTGCKNCENCTNCMGCKNCQSCTSCTGCNDCENCTSCTGCKDCENCTNCIGCKGLRNQTGCIGQKR